MKVLEVKNNLVKIEYTPQDNLLLSGFVIIEDFQSPYVAQVLSLKADKGINYAIVKLLFTFNDEGIVKNYDGTIPALDADVSRLASDELLDILPVNNPLEVGTIAHQGIDLKVDMSIFEKNLLVCSDNRENSNILTENFVYKLAENNSKSIVFDIDGSFGGQKLKFGTDFKLPLNYETINYIYDHDLANIDAASKAVIQEIFLEVQEYSKTVLDKFIPFDDFMAVVDQQYKVLDIPELLLLKNKLLKYKEMNVFAQSPKEIHSLKSAVRANLVNIFDISDAEDTLQNEIIKYVYNTIDEMDLFVYAFVTLTNENADKKLIRHFLTKNKIYTTVVTNHNFKYLFELKERANNLILFVPQLMQHDFSSYNTFLNKLNEDEFIICGKATQNIPLIVELSSMLEDEAPQQEEIQTVISQPAAENISEPVQAELKTDDFSDDSNSYSYETLIEDTAVQTDETDSEFENKTEEQPAAEEETVQPAEQSATEEEVVEEEVKDTEDVDAEDESEEVVDEEEIDESEEEDVDEYENEEDSESEETSAITGDVEVDTETISNIIDKEIEEEAFSDPYSENIIEGEFEEVDDNNEEMITSSVENNELSLPEIEENATFTEDIQNNIDENVSEDALTEDDLNFIQGVNSPTEEGSLPLYPAEELSDGEQAVTLEAGDHVAHPKYGEGIVEKMLRYGNKTLCSISFVNVGRRLLDPAISEITKL